MDPLTLLTTKYSRVSQARSFRVPGYLIVEPLRRVGSLDGLTAEERGDLADALAAAERWIRALGPTDRVYQLRFGESDGAVHFHVIPRTARVLESYLNSHPEEPPFSGARIVDWLWFHQDELGYSEDDVNDWVERAHALVATESQLPKSWTKMAEVASQYCRWIESLEPSDGADFERQKSIEARDLLLAVLSAGSSMEEVNAPNDDSPWEPPEDALKTGFEDVYRRCAVFPFSYYQSNTYNEDRSIEATSDFLLGDLGDDLADIWRDVKRALYLWERGSHQDAAWDWQFLFHCHWGVHAVDALRELQIYLARS